MKLQILNNLRIQYITLKHLHNAVENGPAHVRRFNTSIPQLRNTAEGGWLNDPLASFPQISGDNDEHKRYVLNTYVDPERKVIADIIKKKNLGMNASDEIYQLGEQYLDMVYDATTSAPKPSKFLNEKIGSILETRFNYNLTAKNDNADLPVEQCEFGNVFDQFFVVNRNLKLLELWSKYCSFDVTTYNMCNIPYAFHYDREDCEYFNLRTSSVLFDKSYSLILRLMGRDSEYILDQVLSCSVSKMKSYDVRYGCLLDTKCVILDTCYICKYDSEYYIVTNGTNKRALYDYLTSYIIHCRNSGLDVTINPLVNYTLISLYGPRSSNVVDDLVNKKLFSIDSSTLPQFMQSSFIRINGSYDSGNKILCTRISDVGEDGFDFLVSNDLSVELSELLLKHNDGMKMGFKTYDVARLESGILRPDVDLPPESSPMNASLMWNVEIQKIRDRILFGHNTMSRKMINYVPKVRVGLISNVMVSTDTTILSSSTRMPIGFVTSCVWSNSLQMYISHAYVNTEYTRHDMPVILSTPKKPIGRISKRIYKKYYVSNIFKSFSRGTIVNLPFILHNYPTNEVVGEATTDNEHSKSIAPINLKTRDNRILKSRKEMWKEVIADRRKNARGTLKMALDKWENKNKESRSCTVYNEVNENKERVIPYKRINIIPREGVNTMDIISHYRNLNDQPIQVRHRRYRPPTKTT